MSQMSFSASFLMTESQRAHNRKRATLTFTLRRCSVSITTPTMDFVYFCPSSRVNKTQLCQGGFWVMRLVSLEALHPTGHGSASEIQGKLIWVWRNLYYIIFLCKWVCVFFSAVSCKSVHGRHVMGGQQSIFYSKIKDFEKKSTRIQICQRTIQ